MSQYSKTLALNSSFAGFSAGINKQKPNNWTVLATSSFQNHGNGIHKTGKHNLYACYKDKEIK
jgi:hypothetical protein